MKKIKTLLTGSFVMMVMSISLFNVGTCSALAFHQPEVPKKLLK